MKVAVLGAGPAGLLAAHAVAVVQGEPPDILATGERSRISGSQYLHEKIPGLTESMEESTIRFRRLGSAAVYAEKGGGNPLAPTSWEQYDDKRYRSWSLRTAYDNLWALLARQIQPVVITPDSIFRAVDQYDLVISSIPPSAYCARREEHYFMWYLQVIDNLWPDDYPSPKEDVVIYNGLPEHHWLRCSMIFGHGSTEWPPDFMAGRRIRKPVSTNCDCYPGIIRVGRYGKWDSNGLTHEAWYDAYEQMRVVQL